MVFQLHIFSNPFYFFFSFLQEVISETRIFLQDLEELSPGGNDINMLVATHELESFAIKYGKTHLTVNESAVIVQKLFGEFYALFDESGFFFLQGNTWRKKFLHWREIFFMDYNAGKKSYIVKLLMSGKKMISPKVWGKKFPYTNQTNHPPAPRQSQMLGP